MNFVMHKVLTHHRLLFVVGTAVLGVAASLVATVVSSPGNWTMLTGAAGVMYASDAFAELERSSKKLAASTGYQEDKTRSDVLRFNASRRVLATFFLGALLVAAGVSLKAVGQ